MAALALCGAAAVGPSLPASGAVSEGAAATQAPAAGVSIAVLGQSSWVDADGTFLAQLQVTGAPPRSDVVVSIHKAVADRTAFDQSLVEIRRGTARATFPVIPLDD